MIAASNAKVVVIEFGGRLQDSVVVKPATLDASPVQRDIKSSSEWKFSRVVVQQLTSQLRI